ncbi:substrate-binding periplasmic protein [Pelagibacterium lentulum]|uniref:Amino acid ABC transporter substrate-binding protein n=1 Tax=Pelagibacterium lentulum TaxID=2029865 RepID=A0A916VVB0_9HYPH|nr:transporter substrate-binding domain-containing protein [Pelagibacterium lentulum]GGA42030.1 amino acid ABC transporter substrate-binding protein [Pelagibacterium lentulum]
MHVKSDFARGVAGALAFAMVAGAGAGVAFAQEGTVDDPRLHTPGKLTVGTGDPVYPPWMLNNDPASGEGFENGLVYALAAEMGFAPEDVVWVGQTFDQAIAPGAKPYDFAIQQISVTEARSEVVTFSQVYYQPAKAVVSLPGSVVENATSFAELREANWGVTIGTTDLDYLENILDVDDAAVYDDQVGVFQALQAGQIDATVVSVPTALYVTAVQVPDAQISALLPADENDLGHGLLFEFGNPLVEWVDEALSAVIERGVVEDLVAEYLIADPDLPVITE